MEELFEVTSCYFPIDFTPVSSTFHSFIQILSVCCVPGPVLVTEGTAVNKRNNPCLEELNRSVNWEVRKQTS